jgi:hypothetical protein
MDNGNSPKSTFIPLAEDDAVWIYETRESKDLLELISDPYEWIKRIYVGHGDKRRQAVLTENFVISMDVSASTTDTHTASYVIDGIDHTGVISVRMASIGGRFPFSSGIDYDAIEKKIIEMKPEFVFAQSGDRCFVHLPLGQHVDLRHGLLAGAIENQDWLCGLYGKLPVTQVHSDGTKSVGPKLTFKTITSGGRTPLASDLTKVNILFQGSQSALKTQDACNVGSGLVEQHIVLIDGTVIKVYAPAGG